MIISTDSYFELMKELTQQELEGIIKGQFNGMKVLLDDTVPGIRLSNVLPPSITQRNVVCRWIDVGALTLGEKVRFKKHVSKVQDAYKTVFLSPHSPNGKIELIFDSDKSADSFLDVFVHFASMVKDVVPVRNGKTVYLKYRTKRDRVHKVGGRFV